MGSMKRLWRDIQETSNLDVRREKVQDAEVEVIEQQAKLQAEVEVLAANQAQHSQHPGNGKGVRLQLTSLWLLTLILLVLDIPVQILLNGAALPSVDWRIIVLAAPAITFGLAALIHGAAIAFLYDRDRPARSIRLCRTLAGLSFVATVLGAAIFLFARQASADMAANIVTLTSLSLWTVAEALPLSAGFVFAWAHILGEPATLARRQTKIWDRIVKLERFLGQLSAEEMNLSVPEVKPKSSGLRSAVVSSRPVLFGALFLGMSMLALPPLAHAESSEQVCALMVDRTLSVDPEHRGRAVGILFDVLPTLPTELGCRELVVGTFEDEGPFAPRQWLAVPERVAEPNCEDIEVEKPLGMAGVLSNFGGFRQHYEQQARETCLGEREQIRRQFENEQRGFLATARKILRAPQLLDETETDIMGVLQSLLDSGVRLVLIVTDGLDTVGGVPETLALSGTRVILLLVPARADYGGTAAAQAAGNQWMEAGAMVLPYTVFGARSVWYRLGRGASP